ncbi:MAG: CidA/LrgA family protein [Alphaproteobacteria bacterium]|nr:MAG: CidA/LrgA family protein [Alphaproteobacteria bacterium]
MTEKPDTTPARAWFMQIAGVGFFAGLVLVVDWAVRHTGLPLPAPVVAMALLVLGLGLQKRVPRTLDAGAGLLFRIFPLLFIPPLVALVAVGDILLRQWLVLLFAVTASTFIGLAVTALLFRAFRKTGGRA